ncbi:anti-sigma factor family protein [Streptomyces sp. NBC_01190]|uniref:anti-sigma factor family protein n=1 Tax=Streptomyces sp. NBC_01190 TaxID=2903767 RepID=UPI00386D8436|nr:zf-HC2 domain-containing protein [Streptomyces sp. NBC_01190]
MSESHRHEELLGAYVLGVLDPEETREIDEHTAGCDECRAELTELRETELLLGALPPEVFEDGPPEGGDLLLQRTLRRAREDRADVRRKWSLAVGAAVAASAALVFLGGYLVAGGDDSGTQAAGPVIPTTTGVTSTATPVPGVRVASATDPDTKARMTVRLTPAAGWIRLNAAVTGIPAGERCHLVVVSRDGRHEDAGSWQVGDDGTGAGKGADLDGSAAVGADQVTSVMVQNDQGKTFVTVPV